MTCWRVPCESHTNQAAALQLGYQASRQFYNASASRLYPRHNHYSHELCTFPHFQAVISVSLNFLTLCSNRMNGTAGSIITVLLKLLAFSLMLIHSVGISGRGRFLDKRKMTGEGEGLRRGRNVWGMGRGVGVGWGLKRKNQSRRLRNPHLNHILAHVRFSFKRETLAFHNPVPLWRPLSPPLYIYIYNIYIYIYIYIYR